MPNHPSTCSETNRVIIRIWTSRDNVDYPGNNVGHISIETTSPKAYISLWPVPWTQEQIATYRQLQARIQNLEQSMQHQQAKKLQIQVEKMQAELEFKRLRYFGERDAMYHTGYEEDERRERENPLKAAPPQLTICLYSLDAQGIADKFAELQKKITTWRLIGSNIFVQNIEALATNLLMNTKEIESTVGKTKVDSCASLAYKLLKEGGIYKRVSSSYSSAHSSAVEPDELAKMVIAAKQNELETFPETKGFTFADETPNANLKTPSSCCLM